MRTSNKCAESWALGLCCWGHAAVIITGTELGPQTSKPAPAWYGTCCHNLGRGGAVYQMSCWEGWVCRRSGRTMEAMGQGMLCWGGSAAQLQPAPQRFCREATNFSGLTTHPRSTHKHPGGHGVKWTSKMKIEQKCC